MEGAPVGASRGVLLSQSSSSPSRKQWRVVSEQSARNVGNEELDRSKLGQSDERTIYEQGQELNEAVDFCSIQMDGISSIDDGILQQRIHNLARQREEMQQVEIELRAQLIAKAEIMEMQNTFDARFQEQSTAISRLQEQLREREQSIHELERKMEEKERELHAVRLDNEAAWAKEDLLREQNKEIANYRREHDSIEAERAHHRQQIHELQEHIQDKERQLLELQDQNRVAQETIIYKDEQIRDAQAWMGRVQEMDVLQSSTLQAELQKQTEQYNQLWLGWQRQFVEMERLHLQAIQQLQLELAAIRGNRGYNGESSISQNAVSDGSQNAPNGGNHVEANGSTTPNGNSGGLANGNAENSQQYTSSGNSSSQTNHAPTLPITPSIIGIPSYLPPGQVTAMHPYVMHQHGAGQAVGSHVPQSHVGQFQPVPAMTSFQQWHNQQAVSEGATESAQNHYSLSQAEENSSRAESNYGYGFSINGPTLQHQDYLSNSMGQRVDPSSQMSSTVEPQTLESVERSYFADSEAQHSLQKISSQFHEALRLEPLNQTGDIKAHDNEVGSVVGNDPVSLDLLNEQPSSTSSPSPSVSSVQAVNVTEASLNSASESILLTEPTNNLPSAKSLESALLDERALLASIVRTIPPGGRIRISSTLPNRLGKMLAPLHWHDYKKTYGKLDDFVASHPELFVIEGDYIQLREGAQGIIAATAAVAKVAAAAAASSPYLSFFPPVAITPMADSGRVKKIPSMEPRPVRNAANPSSLHGHYPNGSTFNGAGNVSNVKILSKSKDPLEFNGPSDRSSLGNPQSNVSNHSRNGANFISKQQGSQRTNAALPSRR